MYTHTQKNMENKKIQFFKNVKKIKNIPIKGGRSPPYIFLGIGFFVAAFHFFFIQNKYF